MIGHRLGIWRAGKRRKFARALAACSVALWLAVSLSAMQGGLTPQWIGTHCPSGQAQSSQHSHSHCTWHCGGLDIQTGGGRGEAAADVQVSLVWSLGVFPSQGAVVDAQFPPRGPPQNVLAIIA